MVSIVSSSIVLNNVQADGRRVVREIHEDDMGNLYMYDYMADVNMDINAKMQDRIPSVLLEAIAQQEYLATLAADNGVF